MLTQTSSKPERVALYGRVSSDEQVQAGSIANQIDFGRRFCDLHALEIVESYTDDGVSGTTDPADRPAAGRMLADAKAGRFDTLLVYRLDRLARSLWHLLGTYQKLTEMGVTLRSMTEPVDTSSPIGRFIFQLLGSIAELERETILERSRLGTSRALAEGRPPGRPPAGYARDNDGRFAAHRSEAPLVREIFSLAASGTPAGTIARTLNDRGVPTLWTARGYRSKDGRDGVWKHTAILSILHNKVYWTGQYLYGREGEDPAKVPAPVLVEPAVALKALRQLSANNLSAKVPHRVYLLSGLIRCGECGSAWVGSGGSTDNRPYYRCNDALRHKYRKAEGQERCHLKPMRADLLDSQVWEDIKAAADRPGRLAEKIAAKLSESAGEVEAAKRELDAVTAEYDALLAERLDAQLRSDRGEMSRGELGAYLKAGVGRVLELERRQEALSEQLALRQMEEAQIASVEDVCRRLRDLVAAAENDLSLKAQLVRSLVKGVTTQRREDGKTEAKIEYVAKELIPPDDPDGCCTPDISPPAPSAPPQA